jgi:hypothetical protein
MKDFTWKVGRTTFELPFEFAELVDGRTVSRTPVHGNYFAVIWQGPPYPTTLWSSEVLLASAVVEGPRLLDWIETVTEARRVA